MGPAGGEFGIRGFLAAFEWRRVTKRGDSTSCPVPVSRDSKPGRDSWKTGGASIWLTGSYDPEFNLTYWGVGNPGPDWNGETAKATISTATAWWRSTPTPEN